MEIVSNPLETVEQLLSIIVIELALIGGKMFFDVFRLMILRFMEKK